MHKNQPLSITLILLSILFTTFTVPALSFIPINFCIASTYTAAAMELNLSRYSNFAHNEPQKVQDVVPAVAATDVISDIVSTEKNSDYNNMLLQNESGYSIDLTELMSNYSPPKKKSEPQILIVHTHATEAFNDSNNRSCDNQKNMVAIGNVLCESLTGYGFSVIHDKTQHDYPNYNGSYANSLKTVEAYLEKYPSIDIVLDIHRDGITDADGNKIGLSTKINGQSFAKLMMVVGTDACGLSHPEWRENLKFAAGLKGELDSFSESLTRPLNLRHERFNQHTTKNSIIIEIGSNGNSIDEAIRSAQLLAKAFSLYIT